METLSNEQIIEHISKMSVLDLSNLVKELEEKFGVSAAPVAVAGATAASEQAAEQTEFSVVLAETGPKKINVIKEVRAITGLGLKEAKELVESAPKPVKEGIREERSGRVKKETRGSWCQGGTKIKHLQIRSKDGLLHLIHL